MDVKEFLVTDEFNLQDGENELYALAYSYALAALLKHNRPNPYTVSHDAYRIARSMVELQRTIGFLHPDDVKKGLELGT